MHILPCTILLPGSFLWWCCSLSWIRSKLNVYSWLVCFSPVLIVPPIFDRLRLKDKEGACAFNPTECLSLKWIQQNVHLGSSLLWEMRREFSSCWSASLFLAREIPPTSDQICIDFVLDKLTVPGLMGFSYYEQIWTSYCCYQLSCNGAWGDYTNLSKHT